MTKTKAVILDIDGTISPGLSWTDLTRDLGGSESEHLTIFNAYREGNIDYSESKRALLKLWQTTGNANLNFIQNIFESWPLKPNAQILIEQLKESGYELCLITGSVRLFAKTVATRLGIEHYYANADLVFDDQQLLVDFDYTKNQAAKKLEQFNSFCIETGIEPNECYAIGDSKNDLDIFEHTGKGIFLKDGHAETEIAHKAWRSVGTLEEACQLITGRNI